MDRDQTCGMSSVRLPLQVVMQPDWCSSALAEKLSERFAADSFGDALFGGHLALLLLPHLNPLVVRTVWSALSQVRQLLGTHHDIVLSGDCAGTCHPACFLGPVRMHDSELHRSHQGCHRSAALLQARAAQSCQSA